MFKKFIVGLVPVLVLAIAVPVMAQEKAKAKRGQRQAGARARQQAQVLPRQVLEGLELTDEQKMLLPKGKPVYCHCRSGGRVLAVSKILRAKGYEIRPLKSGYSDLVIAGFRKAK